MPDDLKLRISVDDDTAAPLNKASKNVVNFGKVVKNTATTAVRWLKYIGVSLLGLGIYAIKTAYEFDGLRTKLAEVFGGSSKAAEDWADSFAKSTNRNVFSITNMLAEFGRLFKNMGIGEDEALKLSKQFTQMATALDKTFGGIDKAGEAIKAALAPVARLRELQSKGLLTVNQSKTIAAIQDPIIRAIALFKILESKNKDWQDQMGEKNAWDALTNNFSNFVKDLGTTLTRSKVFDNFFNKISDNLKKIGNGDWVEGLGKKLEPLLNSIANILDPSKSLTQKMASLIKELTKAAFSFAWEFTKALIKEWPSTAMILGTILAAEYVKALVAANIAKVVAGGAAVGGAGAAAGGGGLILGGLSPGVIGALRLLMGALLIKFAWDIGKSIGTAIGNFFEKHTGLGEKVGNLLTPLEGGGKRSEEISAIRSARYSKLRRNNLPTGNTEWDEQMNKKEGVSVTPGAFIPDKNLPTQALSPFRKVNDVDLLAQYNNDLLQKQLAEQQKTREILQKFTGVQPVGAIKR